jgi:hypothetical protein
MEKDNLMLFVIGIVLVVLIWKSGFLFSVFQPTISGFVQWTGRPVCGGSWCVGYSENLVYSSIVQIDTGKNIFKFDSKVESIEKRKICKPEPSVCSGLTHTFGDLD